MNRHEKFRTAGIVSLFAAYSLVRFWRLSESCLWFDEIFSIHAASQPWSEILGFVAKDLIHPPLFYLLLKLWTSLAGEGVFWFRLFPFLFSIAALLPIYFLARDLRLKTSQTLLGILFLAVNGGLIKYAQEVRMYSVVMMLSLFSIWLFVRFFYLGKNIWLLTLINLLLVYTHYFGWFVVTSEILAIIVLQRIKIRQMLIMCGIVVIAFAPWIITIAGHLGHSPLAQNIGWINAPGPRDLFNFAFDLVDPFYFQASSAELASMYVISVPIALILAAATFVYLADIGKRGEPERTRLALLSIIGVFPILASFAASWAMPYSIWGTRHLIIVFMPLAFAAAIMLTGIEQKRLRLSLISLTLTAIAFAFAAAALQAPKKYVWCGWEHLAAGVDLTRPVKIYTFEDLVAYDMWFALRGSPGVEIVKVNGVEGLLEDKAYFIPRGFDAITVTDEDGITGERFYVAFRDSTFNDKHPPLKNLKAKGYMIGEPKVFETPGLSGFLVEISK